MAMLLGYLVALSVLLGGGYLGAQWLGTPDQPQVRSARVESRLGRVAIGASSAVSDAPSVPVSSPSTNEVAANEVAANDAIAANDPAAANDAAAANVPAIMPRPDPRNAQARLRDDAPANTAAQDATSATVGAAATATAETRIDPVPIQPAASPETTVAAARVAQAEDAKPAVKPDRPRAAARKKLARNKTARPLVMMTLRTIEYPDGRRVTRLIPLRAQQAYAWQFD